MSAEMEKRQTPSSIPHPEADTKDACTPAAGPQEADGKSQGSCFRRAPHWRLLLTVAACTLTEVTVGISNSAGNLTPYLTSYLRNSTGDASLDYSRVLWVGNSCWLTYSVAMPLLGLLERRLPGRLYFLIGVVFNAASFFGTYWAIQTSFVATIVFNGMMQGVTQAVLYPQGVNIAMQMFPQRQGLLGGIAMAGYGGGAFIWNQVITLWINPDNLQPDQTVGDYLYFTQAELLERVPTCFLVLGGIMASAQLLSLFCIKFPPKESPPPHAPKQEIQTIDGDLAKQPGENLALGNVALGNPASKETNVVPAHTNDERPEETNIEDSPGLKETPNQETSDYTPRKILKSRVLWTFWLHNATVDYSILVLYFYKTYGQTFIRNDHLLAIVASCGSAFNAACRPFWGLLADWAGFFPAMFLAQSILVVTSATFVLTEMADSSAMYFVWVCAVYVSFSGIYGLQPGMMMAMFGPKYFVFSLGVIFTTGFPSNFLTAPLSGAIIDAFSWPGLFGFVAAAALLGALCLITLLMSCGHPLPGHMMQGLLRRRVTGNTRA